MEMRSVIWAVVAWRWSSSRLVLARSRGIGANGEVSKRGELLGRVYGEGRPMVQGMKHVERVRMAMMGNFMVDDRSLELSCLDCLFDVLDVLA